MDNKPTFNPTIAFIAVLAFILIIVLVFTLRGSSDDETTVSKQPDTSGQVEQPADPNPEPDDPEPVMPAQPENPEEPQQPEQLQEPEAPQGQLSGDWDTLSSFEKAERNPFGCDIETQWVSADDGTCIDKSTVPEVSRDSFPFALGEHASDVTCYYFGFSATHAQGRREVQSSTVDCEMHVHLQPTEDIDPDNNQILWPNLTKTRNKYPSESRPSDHCLVLEEIITLEILDSVFEYNPHNRADSFGGFCRQLTEGEDVEFTARFEISASHFDADVLESLDYYAGVNVEGSALVRIFALESNPIEIPVKYLLIESGVTE